VSQKLPPTGEIFGQELPPVAETFSPQELADLDARVAAQTEREAVRVSQAERFMQMPISQKHRITYLAVRDVRDVTIYLQREYNALTRDLGTILENYASKINSLEQEVTRLQGVVDAMTKEAEPSRVERQLSLFSEDEIQH